MAIVLVVEDNEPNRDMLARRLRRKGYTVVEAVDGEDGVSKARTAHPDLIVMDIELPNVDGIEAIRRIRRSHALRRIPIVVLTAHTTMADRLKCQQAGCDAFETKPVDFPRFLGKIESLLPPGSLLPPAL
jgi:two-component system, cell cycle response regulator DivK